MKSKFRLWSSSLKIVFLNQKENLILRNTASLYSHTSWVWFFFIKVRSFLLLANPCTQIPIL